MSTFPRNYQEPILCVLIVKFVGILKLQFSKALNQLQRRAKDNSHEVNSQKDRLNGSNLIHCFEALVLYLKFHEDFLLLILIGLACVE